MTTRRRDKRRADWRSDWWLWPTAVLLMMSGWGQALWIWENTPPEGLAPLWLLLWNGVGVAGATMPLHWLHLRWSHSAWLTLAAWAAIPRVNDLRRAPAGEGWLYNVSPLLLLLLLGVGLSGLMMGVSSYARRRWPAPIPNSRILRQGFWSALFAVICGWLLIYRAFALLPLTLLAGALILIEVFFVAREADAS